MGRGRGRKQPGPGGPRSSTGHTQPELAGQGPADYWGAGEANRYHGTSRATLLQAELTQSAVALGDLPRGPGVVVDLGTGGGLSSLTFHALAASAKCQGGPPFVIGIDASAAMLKTSPSEEAVSGIRIADLAPEGAPAEGQEGGRDDPRVEISEGLRWAQGRRDVLLADLAQPLPFRPGVLDGALSVSAVQWLLDPRAPADDERCGHQPRLRRLFRGLRTASLPGAKLGLQFYPPKGDHDFGARALREAARAEGVLGDIVLDFPHRGSAKKWLFVGQVVPTEGGEKLEQPVAEPWCALCWPVVAGRCPLQSGLSPTTSIGPAGGAAVRARSERQHLEVALRLARCGRRLGAANEAATDSSSTAIRERLEKDLHPLQFALALAMSKALEETAGPAAKKQRLSGPADAVIGGEEALGREASEAATGAPTKTELRALLMSRLEEVLAVLHAPPAARWTEMPPPLNSEEGLVL